jgi:hypothetical protein
MGRPKDDLLHDMLDRLARLEADNERLRRQVLKLQDPPAGTGTTGDSRQEPRTEIPPKTVSRRGLLRGAGALAAGGLGLAAADSVLSAGPAAANNGDSIVLGYTDNTATAPTGIAVTQSASAGVYAFGVTDAGLNAFPDSGAIAGHTKSTYSAAILGYAETNGRGVQGISQNGSGVYGKSEASIGVYGQSTEYKGMHGQSSSGTGIYGTSGTGDGVKGEIYGTGSGVAVRGVSNVYGEAIRGEITNAGSGYYAIHGATAGGGSAIFGEGNAGAGVEGYSDVFGVFGRSLTGEGVLGTSQSSDAEKAAVHGQHQGAGRGVWGEVVNFTSAGSGVLGSTTGKGAGVEGTSERGRGGVFSGKSAQVRLKPSSAATHPVNGSAGDMFVDASNRLWFCRAGGNPATWTRVA